MVEFCPKENWLVKLNRANASAYNFTSFGSKDISVDVPKPKYIVSLIKAKFGAKSKKVRDSEFIKKVFEEHEEIKENVRNEASNVVTELFCTMATISGINCSEGGKFEFKHISHHVANSFVLDSWIRYFFTVRASWDGSPNWVLSAEANLLHKMCIKYEQGFVSKPKNLGWVAKIISQTKTRRLRELNGNLGRRTGFKLSIYNISDKKGRRKLYHFDAHNMIVRDEKLLPKTKYKVEPIKDDCGVNGMCLLSLKSILPTNAFRCASKAFTEVDKDYSNMIKSKKSPRKSNTPQITSPRKSPRFLSPRKSPRLQEDNVETKKKTRKKLHVTKEYMKKQEPPEIDSDSDFEDIFGIIGHDDSLELSLGSPSAESTQSREKTKIKVMEKFMEDLEVKKKEEEKEKNEVILAMVCTFFIIYIIYFTSSNE